MKTCPICQQAYADNIDFCARDGAHLGLEVRDERECPYCAERILKKARVCKHCGRDVEPLTAAGAEPPPPAAPVKAAEPVPVRPEPQLRATPAPPQFGKPASTAVRPPVPAKPPHFEIIAEPSGNRMKSILIAAGALALVVAVVLYFSHRGAKKGEVRVNPVDGLKYVWIPSGTFTMGCSPGDNECYDFEKPAHGVGISSGFWLGQTPVTVGAYKKFAGATGRQMPPEPALNGKPLNPDWGNDSMPIVDVTWDDAQNYCRWVGGRLPTEAEWEYAARAGSAAARYDDLDQIAWYADNSGRERLDSRTIWPDEAHFQKRLIENDNTLHDVAQKRANALGLFDMLGNVWEWVNDWWDQSYYYNSPAQDPTGPTSGAERVLRGGSWIGRPRDLRASLRSRRNPADKDFDLGFRCGGDMDIP